MNLSPTMAKIADSLSEYPIEQVRLTTEPEQPEESTVTMAEHFKNRAELAEMEAASWQTEAEEMEKDSENWRISYFAERRARHVMILFLVLAAAVALIRHVMILFWVLAAAVALIGIIMQCNREMRREAVDHE